MPRPFTPKVVTANRLLEGDAVWRTATGDWSPRLADAELIADKATPSCAFWRPPPRRIWSWAPTWPTPPPGRMAPSPPISARRSAPAGRPTTPMASRPTAAGEHLMYRYDEFDDAFVRERVGQFRAQVERRIDGALTEEEFKPLRLMNGLYLQLHAYMLRVAIPYGTLDSRRMRQLAYDRRALGQGLWPFHHAPEHPVQLAATARRARHPRGAGRRGNARHPDQRQHHPQRHRRPFRRGGGGRDRRPAPGGRTAPAMVHRSPAVPVPAAQVQDRRLGQPA